MGRKTSNCLQNQLPRYASTGIESMYLQQLPLKAISILFVQVLKHLCRFTPSSILLFSFLLTFPMAFERSLHQ